MNAEQDHIDAVARVFSSDEDRCGITAWCSEFTGRQIARAILATDDPAAVAAIANEWAARHPTALLDALTNAGVLTESWMHRNASGGGSIHETRDLAEAERAEYHHRQGARSTFEPPLPESEGIFRRLVTVWTEVQPE